MFYISTYQINFVIYFNSYQYGPDTYLLQLRDVNFPVRLREYMKVAHRRSPSFALNDNLDWSVGIFEESLVLVFQQVFYIFLFIQFSIVAHY